MRKFVFLLLSLAVLGTAGYFFWDHYEKDIQKKQQETANSAMQPIDSAEYAESAEAKYNGDVQKQLDDQ